MSYDVVCVGSALLDIFLRSDKFVTVPAGNFAEGVALCEAFGGKTEVAEAAVASGGAGTNVAVSMARKGFRTTLVAELGTDLVAAAIKEELTREGVGTEFLVEEVDEETGMSAILVTPQGGRSAIIYRGASKMLTKEDISWEELESQWLYLSSVGGEMELVRSLLEHAQVKGIKVAWNPGNLEITKLKENTQLKDTLTQVEVLMVNREEAAMLLEMKLEDEQVWKHDGWLIDGPILSVITDGKEGGVIIKDQKKTWYEADIVSVVEETGAGDAFGSGLVAALMMEKDLETAVAWAKKQAASVVGYMGAKRGLLKLNELG